MIVVHEEEPCRRGYIPSYDFFLTFKPRIFQEFATYVRGGERKVGYVIQ
jgi:hypothetical protein